MSKNSTISQFVLNPQAMHGPVSWELRSWLGHKAPDKVRTFLDHCPRHHVSPLFKLEALAADLWLSSVFAKYEGDRLGLGNFKALGGAYAVANLVMDWAKEHFQRPIQPGELIAPEVKDAVKNRTVCCATAGNHGASVAAGARHFGCKAVIFVHEGVSEQRRAMLLELGADVIEVPGNYDDSVDECACQARDHQWALVSDTTWNSDHAIPALVMQGYTVLVDEALTQMDVPPTHVFVQGGVGGLAGAVAGHLAAVARDARPMIMIVEPDRADCLMASALAGHPVEMAADEPTVMAMLECYRPSKLAWPILNRYADAFMTLADSAAYDIVQRLTSLPTTEPAIATSGSGGAGLAGLIAAAQDGQIRELLKLDKNSRVLTIITEGFAASEISQPNFNHSHSTSRKRKAIMIMDHLEISTNRFDAMCAFYDAVLAPLDITRIVPGSPAGYGKGDTLPFWVRTGEPVTANAHYAFACSSRALVDAALEVAKASGGERIRKPRLHEHIDPDYFAGYACDPDGHLVEFVCRRRE